jgi:hypothetical protein
MVDRTSQDVAFNVGQGTAIQQSSTGNKQYDASANQVVKPSGDPNRPSAFSGFLDTLSQGMQQYVSKSINKSMEEAYLDGAAKVGLVKTEEELESSPLTRDWTVAGFRDVSAKLALAGEAADMQANWNQYKQMDVKQFGDVLAARRSRLSSQVDGMSLDQRKALIGQQVLGDRADLSKYQALHSGWVLDQKQASNSALINTQLSSLNAAKELSGIDGGKAYSTQAATTFASALALSYQEPTFKQVPEAQHKLATEFITGSLQQDHMQIYQMASTAKVVPGPDGTMLTVMESLPEESRHKIETMALASKERTDTVRLQSFASDIGILQARINNAPETVSPKEVETAMRSAAQLGYYKGPGPIQTFWADYWTSVYKSSNVQTNSQAWTTGNFQVMANANITDGQGAEDTQKLYAKQKMPLPQQIDSFVNVAQTTGSPAALKKVGEIVGPSMNQLMYSQDVNPQALAIATQVIGKLNAYEAKGDRTSGGVMLSTLQPETQEFIARYRENLGQVGGDPGLALDRTRKAMAEASTLTKGDRAYDQAKQDKERNEAVAEIQPEGYLAGVKHSVGSFFNGVSGGRVNKDSAAYKNALVLNEWWTVDNIIQVKQSAFRDRFRQEYAAIQATNPEMPAEAVKSKALATALGSQIGTGVHGPLLLPRGTTMQSFFGVGKEINPDLVGKALETWHKPPEGMTMIYSASQGGKLQATYYNKAGIPVDGVSLDAKEIGPYINKMIEKEVGVTAAARGGITAEFADAPGKKLYYSGVNSALQKPELMLNFRNNLIKHEGVRLKDYPDKVSGKPVAGVGQMGDYLPNKRRDGSYDPGELSDKFMKASDVYAKYGASLQELVGVKNSASFLLFSEMGYQAGNFHSTPSGAALLRSVRAAAQAPNNKALVDQAKTALTQTTPYKVAHKERQNAYMQNLLKALSQ